MATLKSDSSTQPKEVDLESDESWYEQHLQRWGKASAGLFGGARLQEED